MCNNILVQATNTGQNRIKTIYFEETDTDYTNTYYTEIDYTYYNWYSYWYS